MTSAVTSILATEAPLNSPFEVPPVGELFDFEPILFEGTAFQITRVQVILLFGVLFLIAFFVFALRKKSVVPSKIQLIAESVVGFVREQIALQMMGKQGERFVPFLTTLFVFVLVMNWFEILPFVNFPPTSKTAIPIVLAAIVYLTFLFLGFRHQGWRFPLNMAFPPGVPKPLYIMVAPIEFVSWFFVQPITLTVRLFANLFAGHILLVIVFLVINSFLLAGLRQFPVGLFGLIAAPVAIAFEMLVGVLQAYIIAVLAAFYFNMSLSKEH
ncbi:MAG: F0F1 ATP synthase subunit A [Egibacteraceae bacterium]